MVFVPIALSRDVPKATTRAVLLAGEELVIWRGETGAAQVWEDRCPHRGMRLSFGFVRGDRLNCLYHGWEYGSDSRCQRIPAHPDLQMPPSIKANERVAAETGGMIWVRQGDADELPPLVLVGRPIASLAIAADIEVILGLCAATPRAEAQVFATALDGVSVEIGWHQPGPGKTMLHVVTLDPGQVESRVLVALHKLRAAAEQRQAA